jgi:hypothetical protein
VEKIPARPKGATGEKEINLDGTTSSYPSHPRGAEYSPCRRHRRDREIWKPASVNPSVEASKRFAPLQTADCRAHHRRHQEHRCAWAQVGSTDMICFSCAVAGAVGQALTWVGDERCFETTGELVSSARGRYRSLNIPLT